MKRFGTDREAAGMVGVEPAPGRQKVFAMIAGGGTAGHVLPAIAIAKALVARGHPAGSIHFVGSRRGIEGRLVPDAGFAITLLPGRGVARRLTPKNIGAIAGLVAAAGRAGVLVGRRHPSVVVSVGGYASVPCVLACAVLRVPLIVAEQNAVPGAANRLAARVARAAAVSFPGTALPRAVVTGNPVRREVLAVDRGPAARAAARQALGLPGDATVVVAFGGSLGALRINRAVRALAELWRERDGVAIYHIVGDRDWEAMTVASGSPSGSAGPSDRDRVYDHPGGLCYRQVRYQDRMDLVYAAADLAVCRAGASTVSELAAVGLPAVLIPLPGAPDDHQTANAQALVRVGAARMLADADATAERLAAELGSLFSDPGQLVAMSRSGRLIARRDAAEAIASLAEGAARG